MQDTTSPGPSASSDPPGPSASSGPSASAASTTTTGAAGEAARVWSMVLAVLLIPVAFMFGALAPMATDTCGPDHCGQALENTLAVVFSCWFASWTVTPLLVLASWLLPDRAGYARIRRWAAWIAPVPPAVVILLVMTL